MPLSTAELYRQCMGWVPVISVGENAPPGSPVTGGRYVVGTAGSGAWATHSKAIAYYTGAAYTFSGPAVGQRVFNADDSTVYGYDGSAWQAVQAFNTGAVIAYQRTIAFDDPDVNVADPSMTITFPVLPAGAVLTGVSLDVTTAFTDGGGEGTSDPWGLQMALPDGADWTGDLSTVALTGEPYALPASGAMTMTLEPTGEGDLSDLDAGEAVVALYFSIPAVTVVPPESP